MLTWYLRNTRPTVVPDGDVFLISFPKCGRTWLRLLIGRSLVNHFQLSDANPMALDSLRSRISAMPQIVVLHEDNPQWKSAFQLNSQKTMFHGKKVIFLVRDVRDVIVSLYFHKTRRDYEYHGTLAEFIREKVGSVETLITYYNIWFKNHETPQQFLLIRYEDLKKNTCYELDRVMKFLGFSISAENLKEATEYSDFNRMRKMESEGKFRRYDLNPGNHNDPESYKTRRGLVGGYRDYLQPEDISYLNQRISLELSDFFRYQIE